MNTVAIILGKLRLRIREALCALGVLHPWDYAGLMMPGEESPDWEKGESYRRCLFCGAEEHAWWESWEFLREGRRRGAEG